MTFVIALSEALKDPVRQGSNGNDQYDLDLVVILARVLGRVKVHPRVVANCVG